MHRAGRLSRLGKSTQLGHGLGLIMGAKIAHPDKLCINMMGDASIGMVGMDLETAARNRIGTLTIVFNNGVMAANRTAWRRPCSATMPPISAAITARWRARLASGRSGSSMPDEFVPALKQAIEATQSNQPALIECVAKAEFPLLALLSAKKHGGTSRSLDREHTHDTRPKASTMAASTMAASTMVASTMARGLGSILLAGQIVIAAGSVAGAQDYPSNHYPARPVKIIVPAAPGGALDTISRLLAHKVAELWNQQFYIENKPGANWIIGMDAAPNRRRTAIRCCSSPVRA